ncbi:MAG: TatD family hydrolase [Anaerolineaceae bacterium]|nr:TatD family hydrolase [Anaerolineaceae bacterium]
MRFVDTHCHLNLFDNQEELENVINRARQAGFSEILIPGVDYQSSQDAIKLCETYPELYAAVGMHPNSALEWNERSFYDFQKLAKHEKVVAIGEIGLDFYRDRTPHQKQKDVFQRQLELAELENLPVIVHSRESLDTSLAIVKEWNPSNRKINGVFHSFDGSEKMLETAIESNFMISFTGVLTYKSASNLRKVATSISLSNLLLETDAPFLSPHPHRGKRNEPSFMVHTAVKLAELHNISLSKIAEITSQNSDRIFSWRINA